MHYITSHVTLHTLCYNKEVRDLTGCHNIYALFYSLFHLLFLHSYTNLRFKIPVQVCCRLVIFCSVTSTEHKYFYIFRPFSHIKDCHPPTQISFLRKEFLLRQKYNPVKMDDMAASFGNQNTASSPEYHKLI
jgi:hypothetical protein